MAKKTEKSIINILTKYLKKDEEESLERMRQARLSGIGCNYWVNVGRNELNEDILNLIEKKK